MQKKFTEYKAFIKTSKTPKLIIDFKLQDKLDDFVEKHFGKKYVVDSYTVINYFFFIHCVYSP